MTSIRKQPGGIEPAAGPFDGRTEFVSLTFTQKLTWLSEAAASVFILARCNPDAGCNGFFDPEPREADPSD